MRGNPKLAEKFVRQGDCDSLCGLYAITNAVAVCLGGGALSHSQRKFIFKYAVRSLAEEGSVSQAMLLGMSTLQLIRILKSVAKAIETWGLRIQVARPFVRASTPSKKSFAKKLGDHLRQGSGAVVVRFTRSTGDHFTVVRAVTMPTSGGLLLADSLGQNRLPWRSLTLRASHRGRYRYYVHASATIFLKIE